MSRIQRHEATAYMNRWAAVAQQEARELRETPIETKFRQFNALFEVRNLIEADPRSCEESSRVRERWGRIRSALRER